MLSENAYRQLQQALLDAYNASSLATMLRAELGRKLSQYASEKIAFPDIVAAVIEAAEREGWTDDLVRGATHYNPGNRRLAQLAEDWESVQSEAEHGDVVAPSTSQPGGNVTIGGDANAPIITGDVSDSVINFWNYADWPWWWLAVLITILVIVVLTLVVVVRGQRSDSQAVEPTTTGSAAVCVAGVAPSSAELEEMIQIPATAFVMGDNLGERPQHEVTLDAFMIDRFEVTNQQYQQYLLATGVKEPAGWNGTKFPGGQTAFQPVVNVTWYDAVAYCAAQDKRLPTEAEWEYACRGPEGWRFPWGDDIAPANANTLENACAQAQSVGSYSPDGDSAFGVADLAGNVLEWVGTVFRPYPFSDEWIVARDSAEFRTMRGGSWTIGQAQGSCTVRSQAPAELFADEVGFRCAADVTP
ncbi:MAG: SUMF1/EgtB/PvdO family nonheme iron enzyme [Anaerolineae bacterium]|nr:SUMF1/EgtB/PvdO family nonheme iron enzyme [Anaerolineae bacterium]